MEDQIKKVFNFKEGRLVKLSDDKFDGKHPNGIEEGYVAKGYIFIPPTVGLPCVVGSLRTSTVTEVLEDGIFKTLNSTYKLTECQT